MRTSSYILLFSVALSLNCRPQTPLSGTLQLSEEETWNKQIYLLDPLTFDGIAASYMGKVLDSATVAADGSFAFQQLPAAPEPVLLELVIQKKGERFLNKLENDDPSKANYFPIVWQDGERIQIAAEAGHFQKSFAISDPSPANTALLELRDIRLKSYDKWLAGQDPAADKEATLLAEQKALLEFQRTLIGFAENTPHMLPALTAIRWTSLSGDYERIPEFLWQQCQKWQAAAPGHPYVAQLCQRGRRETLPVLIGDIMPDQSMPMLTEDTLSLHQLLAERLTLLDLWASWCVPCRQENQEYLTPLWDKYHEQGFQIIGYSIDAGRKAWQTAVEKDGAHRWRNASHLQGDDAPFFQALRISTIPANFLLDAEGRILARNLHGEELVQFVEEYLR